MAIYRPARKRWRLVVIAGAAGALLGLLVGFLVWGRQEPNAAEALSRVAADLRSAAATLEVVTVEYAESVRGGRVVASPEYRGARAALARSRERYLEAREALAVLDPQAALRADGLYAELDRLTQDRAASEEVAAVARELGELLQGAIGE